MGYTPGGNVHNGCRAGMVRLRAWARREFGDGQARDLGCFNPASVAGGLPSLHADGRADDFAWDYNNAGERAAGYRFLTYAVTHADELGLQEILFGPWIWSYNRRGEGIRDDSSQAASHQNHVHWGVDRPTADTWTEDRLGASPEPEVPPTPEDEDMGFLAKVIGKGGTIYFFRAGVRSPMKGNSFATVTKELLATKQIASNQVWNVSPDTAALYTEQPFDGV
jgi:hypothetical protein